MSDNSTLPATGEVYASDDISAVKYPRVKLITGADGVNDGDVAKANPLPITNVANGSTGPTGVASSATSVQLLAANTARRGLILHNNSTAYLYVKYGTTASIASGGYTTWVPPMALWEMPLPAYQGRIDGIWSAANGYANLTELT